VIAGGNASSEVEAKTSKLHVPHFGWESGW